MTLPDAIRPAPAPRVTIAAFPSHAEADIVMSMLQSRGIDAQRRQDPASGWYGGATALFGGVKVSVPESDAALARELLEDPIDITADSMPREQSEGTEDRCPDCGGEGAAIQRSSATTLLIALVVLGLFYAGWRFVLLGLVALAIVRLATRSQVSRRRCGDCGRTWRSTHD